MMGEQMQTKDVRVYSRRTFIQALLGAPVALAAGALAPKEAEAKTRTIKAGFVRIKLPGTWKKAKHVCWGHTSGIYIDEFRYYLSKKDYTWLNVLRIEMVLPKRGGGVGAPKVSYKGDLYWVLSRGSTTINVYSSNIPHLIWQSAHGQGYHTISKTKAKELLKISTGGKITYDRLVRWSEAKARRQGEKAVRSWVGKKVVKRIRFA